MAHVTLERRGRFAAILIDNPPVHALATPVRAGLMERIAEIAADPAIEGAVITTAGRTFIAGADMREMDGPLTEPQLPAVIAAIAACPKPLVAALFGSVLGGGLEIALACRARIAEKGTQLGFPEVKIGLIPGASGTQRLLRHVDFATAARLVTSGKPIKSAEALTLGLIDAEVDRDPTGAAFARCSSRARWRMMSRFRTCDQPRGAFGGAAGGRRHRTAPRRSYERLRAARGRRSRRSNSWSGRLPFPLSRGWPKSESSFLALREGREAKALRRLFLAEREAGRLPELKDVRAR